MEEEEEEEDDEAAFLNQGNPADEDEDEDVEFGDLESSRGNGGLYDFRCQVGA